MPDSLRRKRQTIAQLRAMADELEADLPPERNDNGNGDGDDDDARARSARERARRLGWGGLIKGTGIAAAILAIGRWLHDRTMPAAVLLAGGAAVGGMALAPAVAPHVPGMPAPESHRGATPGPAVTRTLTPPASPSRTVTATPEPPRAALPRRAAAPKPAQPPDDPGPPDGDPPPTRPPDTMPPSPTGGATPAPDPEPEPEAGDPPGTTCALGVALPPLLGVCVLSGES